MEINITSAVYAVLIAFTINIILCPILIPYLTKLKFGQFVRDDGPKGHIKKAGTPTMGGIMIILSFFIAALFFIKGNTEGMMLMFVTFGFGIIGFCDDYIKVTKKRSLGLKAYQKIILQLLVTTVFVVYLVRTENNYFGTSSPTEILIPFAKGAFKTIDLGVLYIPFVYFTMLAIVNAVNLTDGLDGLAAGVTVLVTLFFIFIAMAAKSGVITVTAAAAGSLLGFLLFNSYPARVIMGDTGSLALGGLVAAVALILKAPLFLVIVGMVYVIENLSVIMQVGYFKMTHGKRLFKMAPIHHSFELSGWSETKIVTLFYIATAIFCLIGFLGAQHIL